MQTNLYHSILYTRETCLEPFKYALANACNINQRDAFRNVCVTEKIIIFNFLLKIEDKIKGSIYCYFFIVFYFLVFCCRNETWKIRLEL